MEQSFIVNKCHFCLNNVAGKRSQIMDFIFFCQTEIFEILFLLLFVLVFFIVVVLMVVTTLLVMYAQFLLMLLMIIVVMLLLLCCCKCDEITERQGIIPNEAR